MNLGLRLVIVSLRAIFFVSLFHGCGPRSIACLHYPAPVCLPRLLTTAIIGILASHELGDAPLSRESLSQKASDHAI